MKGLPMKNLFIFFLLTLSVTFAQMFDNADDVMAAVEARPKADTSILSTSMVITSGSGQSLSRQMQFWTSDDNTIIKFTYPPNIEGSGFLSLDDGNTEENFLWLPALGRVRRLASNSDDKQDSFFGSDFTYEDIDELNENEVDKWNYSLLEIRDGPVYIIESTPKEGNNTAYEQIILEISEETLISTRNEYYKDGQLFKILDVSEVAEVNGYLVPIKMKMETITSGSFTMIEQKDISLDEEIPDEVFSERFLRR